MLVVVVEYIEQILSAINTKITFYFIAPDQSCELVSLEKYLARLRPGNWTQDETSLAVSNLPCSPNCEPYSQLACIVATLSMSFEMGTIPNSGYEFAGDYEPKGCYVYMSGDFEGLSFFGTGGTVEEMQQSLQNPKERPQGYDCNSEYI